MSLYEIIFSIVISLITGCISGWITGIMVTRHYRKKDEKASTLEARVTAHSEFMSYLESILSELEIIDKAELKDYSMLERLLKNKRIHYDILPLITMRKGVTLYRDITQSLSKLEKRCERKDIDIQEFKNEISQIILSIMGEYLSDNLEYGKNCKV